MIRPVRPSPRYWSITCDQCGRPGRELGLTEAEVLALAEDDGWVRDEPTGCHFCKGCAKKEHAK